METNISNKCKAYTSLEQSKELAKILPLESADMAWYSSYAKEGYSIRILNDAYPLDIIGEAHDDIPCWSLAALLKILPSSTLDSSNDHYYRLRCMERFSEWYDNPIDTCYEMILMLNKLNLL